MQRALIIFVKYPQAGLVKSRLGKSIGNEKATQIYGCFVETLLSNLNEASYKIFIFYAPADREMEIKNWLGQKYAFVAQSGNDLGERLLNAFEYVFNTGAKQAVVIGTDSPLIERKNILNAFSRLDEKDCVIGPTYDGGYYLLGLNCVQAELFTIEEYSTDRVFENTMEKAQNLGLNVQVLEKCLDVDTVDDLNILKKELEKSSFHNIISYNELRDKIKQF